MKKQWTMLLVVMFALTSLVLTSCSDDDDDSNLTTMNAADVVAYMDANEMTQADFLTGWKISAADLYTLISDGVDTNDPYIMDLRSSTLYGKGHIQGAHNVLYADVLDSADTYVTGQDIVVQCYTGQSAAHAVVALRLAGYSASSLGYGISGWRADIDDGNDGDLTGANDLQFNYFTKGTGNVLDSVDVASAWIPAGSATGVAGLPTPVDEYLPTVSYSGDSEAAILRARAEAILGQFKKISAYGADGVLENVDDTDLFINHFWSKVAEYGNIKNSYNIYPMDITLLDPSKKIINCCWTGQSASIIAAYLTAIGYESWTLGNGANSMVYDAMTDPAIDSATGWGAYPYPTVNNDGVTPLPIEGTVVK
ncbi:MAG: rhodanese-like domain-containing protein [Candidatus Delongbacteria bacterium]|jgi:rhodanese-related sulfurtransferase|nr:rhodanese-like domain-containing protein [Candidatus Delongbacteria bacterium]